MARAKTTISRALRSAANLISSLPFSHPLFTGGIFFHRNSLTWMDYSLDPKSLGEKERKREGNRFDVFSTIRSSSGKILISK